MIWPWSMIRKLNDQLAWYRERENYHLFHIELNKNTALKALRELSAAHKGIRRLVSKVNRLKAQIKEGK
jgi:hypothetical protein